MRPKRSGGKKLRHETKTKTKPRKKPITITLAAAMNRIDHMIKLVVENVRAVISLEAMLETGNEAVTALRNGADRGLNWYGANCYNVVIHSVTLNMALTLARLFDLGVRSKHRNKRDVASIPLLLSLVKQKRCCAALSKRAREWTPLIGMAAEHEMTVRKEIDAAISVYRGLTITHKGRLAASTLKGFRDQKLAHSLMVAVSKPLARPRFEELTLLLNTAVSVTAHLRLAIDGQNWDPTEFKQIARHQGNAFWGPAIAAVVEAEKKPSKLTLPIHQLTS